MTSTALLLDPGFRLPVLLGGGAMAVLSLLAIYLAGSRLLLTGMALAQGASAGAALSLVIPWPPTLLATLVTALTAALSTLFRQRSESPDAGLLVLYLAGGVAAQLLAASSGSGDAQVLDLLNGQLLLATASDAWALGAASLLLLALIPIRRPLLLLMTQRTFAISAQLPVGRLDAVALLVVGILVGVTFPILGVLCTTAALTCPGLIALHLAPNLRQTPPIAFAASLLCYVAGMLVAFHQDWPPGPVIAAMLVLAASTTLLLLRRC